MVPTREFPTPLDATDEELRTLIIPLPLFSTENGQIRCVYVMSQPPTRTHMLGQQQDGSVHEQMVAHAWVYSSLKGSLILTCYRFFHSHYQVVVVIIPLSQTQDDLGDPDDQFQDPNTYSSDFCKEEFTTPLAYITAEFGRGLFPESGVFVVGAGGTEDPGPYSPNDRQESYTNGLLCYNKQYTFFVRAYPELDSQVRSLDAYMRE